MVANVAPTRDLTVMFPRLTELSVSTWGIGVYPEIFTSFARPELRSLDVWIGRTRNPRVAAELVVALAEYLSSTSNTLDSLKVTYDMPSGIQNPDAVPSFSQLARGLTASKSLRSYSLNFPAGLPVELQPLTLGGSRFLNTITLETSSWDLCLRSDSEMFPFFQHWEVDDPGHNAFMAAGFVRSLTHIRWVIKEALLRREYLHFSVYFMNLRELIVTIGPSTVVQWEDVQGVLACARLELVRLGCADSDLQIDDSRMQQIAKAWPAVKELAIHHGWNRIDRNEAPSGTLRGLECLAMHCPHLKILSMAVDARVQAVVDGTTAPLKSLPSLESACLGLSPAGKDEDAEKIARDIDALWPNLINGWTIWDDEPVDRGFWQGEENLWDNVWSLLWERQDARKDAECTLQKQGYFYCRICLPTDGSILLREVARLQERNRDLEAQLAALYSESL